MARRGCRGVDTRSTRTSWCVAQQVACSRRRVLRSQDAIRDGPDPAATLDALFLRIQAGTNARMSDMVTVTWGDCTCDAGTGGVPTAIAIANRKLITAFKLPRAMMLNPKTQMGIADPITRQLMRAHTHAAGDARLPGDYVFPAVRRSRGELVLDFKKSLGKARPRAPIARLVTRLGLAADAAAARLVTPRAIRRGVAAECAHALTDALHATNPATGRARDSMTNLAVYTPTDVVLAARDLYSDGPAIASRYDAVIAPALDELVCPVCGVPRCKCAACACRWSACSTRTQPKSSHTCWISGQVGPVPAAGPSWAAARTNAVCACSYARGRL